MEVKPLGFIDQSEGVQISVRSWRWPRRSKIWPDQRDGVDKAGNEMFQFYISLTFWSMNGHCPRRRGVCLPMALGMGIAAWLYCRDKRLYFPGYCQHAVIHLQF
jgi:hypothetical protein